MLRFNTFRARRYLRTKFVEGKFLLASEASDLELEIVDLLRTSVKSTMGDVAISDAWKIERLSDTSVLVKPGEAWFKGLPFMLRSGKDQLVSGAILTLGTVPVGVSAADDASGLGKVINFNDSATTPTNNYRFVITAREELVTDIDDPFLKNANLSESTGQKVRLNFRLNIVPVSSQTEAPIPYRDENSTSGGPVTNFPDAGSTADPNFVNQVTVSPTAAGNGELISLTPITGSEAIDGRDLEIVVRNDSGLGGGNPLPNSPTEQQNFANGKLIDSVGTEYHINALFNDTISTQLVIRIDKEANQPNPEILNGSPYTLMKRDVYATDDINGNPQGFIHWSVAELDWDSTTLLSHNSKLTDLRNTVEEKDAFQRKANIKDNLILAEGGDVSFDATSGLLAWTDAFKIKHPFGTDNTIAINSVNMLPEASLVYDMDLSTGGAIEKGNTVINITGAGTTITIDPVTYTTMSVGNVVVDSGGTIASITSIDPDTNQLTVSAALVVGAGTVFLDQYAAGTAPLSSNAFHLAVRSANRVYFYRGLLELEDGETSQIGDGASQQLFTFIGSAGDADDSPDYSSEFYVTDGDSLVTAIGKLDTALDGVAGAVTAISWKSPVSNFAALPGAGNTDGDVRLVLDTRVAYHWDDGGAEWLPLTGTGGGLKVTGGGTVAWALGSSGVDTSSASASTLALNFTPAPGAQNGQTFTTTTGGTLSSIDLDLAYLVSPLTGDIVVDIYNTTAGAPTGAAIATSDDFDLSALTNTLTTTAINFTGGPTLAAATVYGFIIRDGTSTPSGSISVGRTTSDVYAGGNLYAYDGVTFTSVPGHDITPFAINTGSDSELSFTSDMYLEKAGLDYTDNTIPTSESPIALNTNGAVAYVTPNLSTGGPNLTVTVDTLDNVPLTAVIIARRDSDDAIVGSSSSRVKNGESKELYQGTTDQERDKLYAQASSYFRSDNPVTWTGTEVQFTTDIVLDMLKEDGTEQSYTVLAADSPIAVADGQYIYLTVDRTNNSDTLSFTVGSAPAEAAAGSEVVIFGKRQDVTAVGYLHLPLHKQVLEPGQTVRLGASGAGGGEGNPILETLKNRLLDSTFQAVTPQVFSIDKDTLLDGASTGAFSLVTQNFEFTAAAETMVTTQMLDSEFLASGEFLTAAEFLSFWDLANIDTGATYEISRNGGNEWQTVDMPRVDTTDLYRGYHVFDTEAVDQTVDSQATSNNTEELNATTQLQIGQALTIANTTELREVDLDLVVNDSGALEGNIFVAIYSDNTALPDTLLTETNAINVNSLSTGTNTIDLPNTVLTTGTYHIVVRTDAQYKSVFATGVDSISLDSDSGGTTGTINGGSWGAGTFDLVYSARGIEYDLRLRVTSSAASNMEGTGVLYQGGAGGLVTGVLNREVFKFKAVADNDNSFTLTKFVPNADTLKVYYVEAGQVMVYPSFVLSGQTIEFAVNQFNNGGVEADVTLIFDQTEGGAIDNSDLNGLLLASNFLGSTDASIDRSANGRGIFLRRPDGTLRELTIDDNDDIVIYSI